MKLSEISVITVFAKLSFKPLSTRNLLTLDGSIFFKSSIDSPRIRKSLAYLTKRNLFLGSFPIQSVKLLRAKFAKTSDTVLPCGKLSSVAKKFAYLRNPALKKEANIFLSRDTLFNSHLCDTESKNFSTSASKTYLFFSVDETQSWV